MVAEKANCGLKLCKNGGNTTSTKDERNMWKSRGLRAKSVIGLCTIHLVFVFNYDISFSLILLRTDSFLNIFQLNAVHLQPVTSVTKITVFSFASYYGLSWDLIPYVVAFL